MIRSHCLTMFQRRSKGFLIRLFFFTYPNKKENEDILGFMYTRKEKKRKDIILEISLPVRG
jgi:hypothetical protein